MEIHPFVLAVIIPLLMLGGMLAALEIGFRFGRKRQWRSRRRSMMRVTMGALAPLAVGLAIVGITAVAGADQPAPHPTSQITEGRTLITLPDTTGYSPDERAILTLERGRSAAIARGDTTWLANLYAPDFRGVAGNGHRIERADLFRIFGRDDPVSRFLIDELSIRSYGTAATVAGRLRTLAATGEVTAESRYLHVYVTREGRWLLVAAQATVVPQPAKR